MKLSEELRRYWLAPGTIAASIVAFDQISKAWIWDVLGPVEGTSRPLIEPWLSFTLVKNTGVAFGMFQGIPHFFTVTSILISLGAIYFYRFHLPRSRPWVQLSLGMIVGGAIGNIIDRIRQGFVVDFVHVSWFPGIFNVADAAITVGVAMLAIYLVFTGEEAERRAAPPDDALLGELLGQDPPGQR
ncbi:MAG: signal peptidase II [Chloroflexota bacterium]|nr:MAG: signal peptidase II [Chloroflexota bacterium]